MRRRGRLGIMLRIASTLALMLIVLFVALAFILASGPVELGVLRERVAETISRQLGPGYDVTVGAAMIDVDPVMGLMARFDEIRVDDRGHGSVAHIPTLRLGIDPLSLLRLRLDITQVEVSDPDVSLVRGGDGRIYLGTADHVVPASAAVKPAAADRSTPPPALDAIDGGFPDLFTALHIMNGGLEPAIDAAIARNFQRLNVDAATIHIWDAKKLQQRVFPHTDLSLNLDPGGTIKATFATSGYAGRWGIVGERSLDPKTGDRNLTLSFSQLTLADIEPNFGRPESLIVSDIPLFGRATVVLGADGDVKDAQLRFDLGAGKFVSGFGKDTVLLDEATIRVHWDIARRSLILEPSNFQFGPTSAVLTGAIKPLEDRSDGRYSFEFESRGAMLASDSNSPPIVADRIALVGTADFPGKRIDITDFDITTPVASVAAAGTLGLEGATPSMALSASFTPMSISALKQIWPPTLAGPARKWVLEHVIGGRIASGHFEAAVPGGVLWTGERVTMPENYMRLDARLEDVSFTTVGTIPAITNVSGNAVVAGSTFGIDIDKGTITAPSGKSVDITAGIFAVPNTAVANAESRIETQFEGDVGAIAEIANSEPMRAMSRNGINPANLSGDGRGSLSITMPLKPGLLPSDIKWSATLDTTNFASTAPIEDRIIKGGAFAMTASADAFSINGKATINGVPATIDLTQPLRTGDGDSEAARRSVQLVLDADARKRLGIGLDNMLGGTVGASITDLGDGRKGQHYEFDLKQARLMLQALGWTKGIGVPAKLVFDMVPRPDGGFLVDNMVATGDGFGFRGKAVLDAKYGLVSADIDRFALRKGDQISVALVRKGDGYQITARGASFDARGLIAQLKSNTPSPDDSAASLSVDAKIDSITGFGQVTLSNSAILVSTNNGAVGKASLKGSLPGGGVAMVYKDSGSSGASLDLQSADAGNLFSFVDLYRRISGGKLRLSGERSGAKGPFSGVFDVASFAIVDEASMRKLVSASTGTGEAAQPSGLDPDHVPFDRMRLDYTKRGSLIVIEDAVLRGATVGATLNGTIDLAKQVISVAGTYLPAYAVNNLFGRLPLIGLALGGGSQGGLFGVTFKVEGPISGPSLTVNPLSMITPGIFRKIFEFPVN
ncbi:AsmA-like C-terminal region [Kaistia soli DSM 19436]|uniref:AsmA-like C-terminal region n=2 Tax=Kaistia TaxID=166953 RepID=A0A1M5GY02_9HYPH|nr:AsmA-like C-terminal region [Kaistia soli DSM 19436]